MTTCRQGAVGAEGAGAGALRLRAWAIGVLWGEPGPPPGAESEAAWELFLRLERCALPLRRRCETAGTWDGIPPAGRNKITCHALRETQRALSAGAELRRAAAVLRAGGERGLVLKGGAYLAAGGDPVDVADVDLLVRPRAAVAFGRALSDTGEYATVGEDAAPGTPGRWEAATRAAPGSVQVEVHFAIPYLGSGVDPWAGALPTPVAGVFRMAPALHLWHVLVHGVSHHPDRRGALRDLLLAAAARAACSPADLSAVRARIERHPHRDLLDGALAMAVEAAAGPPVDRFADHAALRCIMAADAGPRRRMRVVHAVACAAAEGRAELLREVLGGRGERNLSPGPGGPLWSVLRMGSRLSALPAAIMRLRAARALAAGPRAGRT